jgi:twitching motility protein PilT
MPGRVSMEKLLATVIQLKASDLHISVGQPPVVRHQGRMKKLDLGGASLDNDDCTALMKSITPDRCQQELQTKGGADLPSTSGKLASTFRTSRKASDERCGWTPT